MKAGFTTLAKLLSVCLFLGLLSGYVWYRQDQAKKEEVARAEALDKARERAAQLAEEEGSDAVLTEEMIKELQVMSSSKSMMLPSSKIGIIDLGDEDIELVIPEEQADKEDDKQFVIPSSKDASMESLRKTDPMLYQAIQEALKKGETRVVMPSSKSGVAVDINEFLKLRLRPEWDTPQKDQAQPQKQQK